jgi:hypothetical protein
MMNYFFFVKISKDEFEKKYHMGPLKSFMKLEQVGTEKFCLDANAEEKINKKLQICQTLIYDDFMIVPYAASLISKFPFVEQMNICIDKLVKMYFDSTIQQESFDFLIKYLIKGIIVPGPNKYLNFYIPYLKYPLKIYGSKLNEIPCVNNNFWRILKYFSIENICIIFFLIIMEQKIVFVANKHKILSEVIDCFVNLIYPFQ